MRPFSLLCRFAADLPVYAMLCCILVPMSAAVAFDEIALTTSPGSQSTDSAGTSTAALVGGGFATVWISGSLTGSDLQIQWLDADGLIMFEQEGRTIATQGIGSATLAAAPMGGAFVAFGGSFGSPGGVRVQSFNAAGVAQWPGEGILTSTLSDDIHTSPLVVPDADGGVFVCAELLNAQAIRCQHVAANGTLLWAPEGISPGGAPGIQSRPLAVADGAGGLLVFWRNQGSSTEGPAATMFMEGQRLSRDGSRLWSNGTMIRDTFLETSIAYQPDFYGVISDGTGGAVLAFEAKADSSAGNQGIVAQRVDRDGSLLWGSGTVVIDDVASTQHRTSIQPHDGGIVVISSQDIGEVTTRLRLFRLGPDGSHLWPESGLLLSDPASVGHNLYPQGSFDHGILRVAWTYQLPESQFEMDIAFARYAQDGSRLSPGIETVTSAPITQSCSSVVYSYETDKFFVLWDDLRTNNFENSDIYATESTATAIFADGFELGNTSTWSSGNP